MDMNELKKYRHETVEKFFLETLGVPVSLAQQNASALIDSLDEEVLAKLVHFFDFSNQCIVGVSSSETSCKCSTGQKCSSCTSKKDDCATCNGECCS